VVGVGIVLFVLGWALGRCSSPPERAAPTSAATTGSEPATTTATRAVELRLDAGGLRLLPDASLHLEPIRPLGSEDLDEGQEGN